MTLPVGAEGWFAIPTWQVLGSSYHAAIEQVLVKMSQTRSGKVKNWLRDELDRRYLKESEKTLNAFATLQREQKGRHVVASARVWASAFPTHFPLLGLCGEGEFDKPRNVAVGYDSARSKNQPHQCHGEKRVGLQSGRPFLAGPSHK